MLLVTFFVTTAHHWLYGSSFSGFYAAGPRSQSCHIVLNNAPITAIGPFKFIKVTDFGTDR